MPRNRATASAALAAVSVLADASVERAPKAAAGATDISRRATSMRKFGVLE